MKLLRSSLLLLIALIVSAATLADVKIKADVVYGHKDGMALVYDVIQPANANGAAIVYMVSGGWFSRWAPPENRAQQFADILEAGFTVIPVHHGSAPRYKVPEAYADVSRAIRHIKMNAEAFEIDVNRIGVTGGSAGPALVSVGKKAPLVRSWTVTSIYTLLGSSYVVEKTPRPTNEYDGQK